jgi:hypothetical protein
MADVTGLDVLRILGHPGVTAILLLLGYALVWLILTMYEW